METSTSIRALGWRPGIFLFVSLFLAGDLADDAARETMSALHLSLDILSLSIAVLAFVASAWQSWRALRCAREAAASPDGVSASRPGSST